MLEQVIAKFEAKQEREQDKTAWRVHEQRILEDLAFPLWMQCREHIEAGCRKYSQYLDFEVEPNTSASVRGKKTKLYIEYFPNSHTIAYQLGGITRRYSMRINNERQAVLWDQTQDIFKTPAEVADELLSLIFTRDL